MQNENIWNILNEINSELVEARYKPVSDQGVAAVDRPGHKGPHADDIVDIKSFALDAVLKEASTCDICGKAFSSGSDKCVDHNHTIGKNGVYAFRGILCHNCNLLLGKIEARVKELGNGKDIGDYLGQLENYLKLDGKQYDAYRHGIDKATGRSYDIDFSSSNFNDTANAIDQKNKDRADNYYKKQKDKEAKKLNVQNNIHTAVPSATAPSVNDISADFHHS